MVSLPYLRKISTSLVLSSAILLLAATSPLLLFNPLQPVQAQTSVTFRTVVPAEGTDPDTRQELTLTFDAQGTFQSGAQSGSITSGTYQLTSSQGEIPSLHGRIVEGEFRNTSQGMSFEMSSGGITPFTIISDCNTQEYNLIHLQSGIFRRGAISISGPVECSSQGGGTTHTTQSSSTSSTAGSSQDGDGDGIHDADDNCPNHPHTRCYKEGNTANSGS